MALRTVQMAQPTTPIKLMNVMKGTFWKEMQQLCVRAMEIGAAVSLNAQVSMIREQMYSSSL